jgi:hypothetical protein
MGPAVSTAASPATGPQSAAQSQAAEQKRSSAERNQVRACARCTRTLRASILTVPPICRSSSS